MVSLLLPFTFSLDPYTALAFLVGVQSVTTTSDTIPAVLFGVPGTTGSAATVLDGYPMAKGEQVGLMEPPSQRQFVVAFLVQ